MRGGDYVKHLVRVIKGLSENDGEPPRLFVVTRNAQTVLGDERANLEQAGLRGLLRSVGNEYPDWRVTQIDLDDRTDAERLARQLLSGSEEDETAWRDGEWYTARLFPGPLRAEERFTALADPQHDGMRLQIRTPGDLQTIELTAFDRVPPGPSEIEVAVTSSSINFADVLVTFGRYPSFEGRLPQLGTDFAGVVTAVGSDVTTHQVGDRVGGISPNGCWGTFVTCDADLAATLPAGLTEQQAAAVTTAHATAWYGLQDLARIGRRDKVLIHSATGGVGQAAIAIARAAGAEIFATAGSEQRRQLLRDWGIEHVYDSRSVEFAEQIRTRHRRLRRRHRAQLGDRCRTAGRHRIARARRTIHRDRQARHLRRLPTGTVPVPPQPRVPRGRPGSDVAQSSRTVPRPAGHRLPADRRRCAADAGEHALPT